MSRIGKLAAAAAGALVLMSLSAAAQELKIGIKTEPSSLDPQFHTLNPNIQVGAAFLRLAGAAGREPEAAARRWRCPGRRSTTRPGNSSCAPT